MTEKEIERVAKDYIERGRTDVYGRPNLSDWEYVKANKPFAYAEAIRLAKWALSIQCKGAGE